MAVEVVLNLQELVELETVTQHHGSGLIKAGAVFNRDQNRPQRVVELVRRHFEGIAGVSFRLGTTSAGGPYLVAMFARGANSELLARARVPGGPWTPEPGHKDATAHIYEGAIGNEIVEVLGGRGDLDEIFAAIIVHEIGHNFGLEHEHSPTGVMYAYEDGTGEHRRAWLQNASAGRLELRSWQARKIELSVAAGASSPGTREATPAR